MPQWQLDPELKKRQLDQIKQAIDADGDGQISAKEFNIATQRLGLNGFIMQELGGQQQPAMVLMAQPPMVNVMNVGQAQTAVTEPGMLCEAARGSFVCQQDRDCIVTIGPQTYNHSEFGNIPITVTSNTTFSEDSGNATWVFNVNASLWSATMLRDVGVGRPGTAPFSPAGS